LPARHREGKASGIREVLDPTATGDEAMSNDNEQTRREKAEKWIWESWSEEEINEISNRRGDSNAEIRLAYLAGHHSRDEEVDRLKLCYQQEFEARNRNIAETVRVSHQNEELRAEIAALRERIRWLDMGVKEKIAEIEEGHEEYWRVKRALEEKP